jgi:hypothetical protein
VLCVPHNTYTCQEKNEKNTESPAEKTHEPLFLCGYFGFPYRNKLV